MNRIIAEDEAGAKTMTIARNSGKNEGNPRPEGRPAIEFGSEIKMRMGQQLRVMYSEVMNEGVPDRHHELLLRLQRAGDR